MGKENCDEKRTIITSSLLVSRPLEGDERLLHVDPELKEIYNFNAKQIECYTGISSKKSSELVNFLQSSNLPQYISYLEKNRFFYMTIWDEDYPKLLREIQDPPFVLYGKGEKRFSQ